MVTDRLSLCPHGWLGPWYGRPCGCKLIAVGYSEVAMHMKVAGTVMWAYPVRPATGPFYLGAPPKLSPPAGFVQLYTLDNQAFSMPITMGESGYEGRPVGGSL